MNTLEAQPEEMVPVARKVTLQMPRGYGHLDNKFAFNPSLGHIVLSKSLPYFRTATGTYVHRVRAGVCHYRHWEYSHTSLQFWCGNFGLWDPRERRQGRFFGEPPCDAVICATCEGRAIGAGQLDSHAINGRIVRFSPRV